MIAAGEDVLAGDLVKALMLFRKAYNSLQVALMPCKNMQNDLAALKAWAYVFEEPAHLGEVLTNHWLHYGGEIKASIGQTSTNWNSGLFFESGEASAEAFTLLFGQVE